MTQKLTGIVAGYLDAKRAKSPHIPKGKGAAYVHGWLNGWADRHPAFSRNMSCDQLQRLADYCEQLDALAGIQGCNEG